jgi:hypothetical protein
MVAMALSLECTPVKYELGRATKDGRAFLRGGKVWMRKGIMLDEWNLRKQKISPNKFIINKLTRSNLVHPNIQSKNSSSITFNA